MQVESAMAMQSLAPQIKAIQERYAGDQVTLLSFWDHCFYIHIIHIRFFQIIWKFGDPCSRKNKQTHIL